MKTMIAAIGGLVLGLSSMGAQADTVVSITQYSYDYMNRPICTAVRMNMAVTQPTDPCTPSTTVGASGPDRIDQNVYDAAGQLLAVYQGVGTSDIRQYAYYNYTNNGLKTFEIDANHNKTSFTYDGFDRLKKIQYPNTIVGNEVSSTTDIETFTYDENNNRKTWVRRNGQTITYTYDNLNREIIADVPAHLTGAYNATEKDIYTTYDGLGHISKKAFASYTGTGVSYLYDGLGRVSSTTDMAGRTISYGYNAASARTQMTYPPLTISTTTLGYVTYGLDNLSRVSAMSYTLATTTTPIIAQTYDSLGRRTNLYRGTTTTSGAVANTAYTYDNLGRLSGLSNDVVTPGYDSIWTFPTRNAAGQIVTWTSNSAVYDYVELATTAENKTYDGLNRDATIASVTGGYDTNGNMANDGSRAVTYDIYNRVLSVAPSATPNAPYLTLSYDPEGRLYQRAYSGTYDTYLYDGTNLIGEYASGGTARRRYIHGTGVDEPLVWLEGQSAATPRYLISNYQGSIIAHTDNTGAIAQIYKYGPYGEPRNAANGSGWNVDATTNSRFQYTGQTTLPEASLYYYKARVYDPAMGRFLQTDPVGSKDDLNLYGYTRGDPINGSDPTGQTTVQAGVAGTLNVFGIKINLQVGIAADHKGNVATYGQIGGNVPAMLVLASKVLAGEKASTLVKDATKVMPTKAYEGLGVVIGATNASGVSELGGHDAYENASLGGGVGGTIEHSTGQDSATNDIYHGLSLTIGEGVGAGVDAGDSFGMVSKSVNPVETLLKPLDDVINNLKHDAIGIR